MNVKEMLAALEQYDPKASASDALKEIRAAAAAAAVKALLTGDGIRAAHAKILAEAKTHKDSKGNGNDDPDVCAFNSIRSEVQYALQLTNPPPVGGTGHDPEDVHYFQKKHNQKLWKRADELVAAAGITVKGEVS